jgi:hypothetical protein
VTHFSTWRDAEKAHPTLFGNNFSVSDNFPFLTSHPILDGTAERRMLVWVPSPTAQHEPLLDLSDHGSVWASNTTGFHSIELLASETTMDAAYAALEDTHITVETMRTSLTASPLPPSFNAYRSSAVRFAAHPRALSRP